MMRFGQKLAYMVLGGLLVLAGHVLPGLAVLKATAQAGKKPSAEFDTLTVRSLKVVDSSGRLRAQIEAPAPALVEDVMQVFSTEGVSVYRVRVFSVGVLSKGSAVRVYKYGQAAVSVCGYDGKPRIEMGVSEHGGVVDVLGNDGEPRAGMGVSEHGGGVGVLGNDGKVRAAMFVDEDDGGYVGVYGSDGKTRAAMSALPEGGFMHVVDNDGKIRAGMVGFSDGGKVLVHGNDGEPRAIMSVDERGHGSVSTLDPNGYQTGKLP